MIIFSYVFFVNAWVVDEGYVTFRTIDNFVHGYGLNWNVQERVQAYTHPMWLFVICLAYLITSEFFFTSIGVSYLFSVAAIIAACFYMNKKSGLSPWQPVLLVLALLASKGFIDYTSSGLENPLSYFLAILFYGKFLIDDKKPVDYSAREIFFLFFVASLAFFNRQDTVLLYIVPLVYLFIVHLRRSRLMHLITIVPATAPAWLWLIFSLIYYGFPYPNTAYAKLINAGVPLGDRTMRGLEYLLNSLIWDGISHIILLAAIVLAIRKKSWRTLMALSAVLLYYLYTVTSAASATHMSGRFFSVPFFVAIFAFVLFIKRDLWVAILSGIIAVYIIIHPMSNVKIGTGLYYVPEQSTSCMDTRYLVDVEGGGFRHNIGKRVIPDHPWYYEGLMFREQKGKVHIGGAKGSAGVGYFAYASGPDKYIIDIVGLGDPLMARLPAANTAGYLQENWQSGHFYRMEPIGYLESVRDGVNYITDPLLHEYYDHLLNIVSGPVFSRQRLQDIYHMNMGHYQHLLRQYTRNIIKARRMGIL